MHFVQIIHIKRKKSSSLFASTPEPPISSQEHLCTGWTIDECIMYLWTLWSMYESYVVVISCCQYGAAVSESRQVLSLHCHPRCHDVKHCVENCLHCGWGEVYCHDACFYKRWKIGFSVVDNMEWFYSHVCGKSKRNLSDRYPNSGTENVLL